MLISRESRGEVKGMSPTPRMTVLCLASFFKGNRFFQRLHEEGCYVILLTSERFKDEAWAREYIHEFHSVASFEDRTALINGVAWLFRNRRIDRIVALDDFDVEVGAALRSTSASGAGRLGLAFLPGQAGHADEGEELGINVPRFTSLFHHPDVARFLEEVASCSRRSPSPASSSTSSTCCPCCRSTEGARWRRSPPPCGSQASPRWSR